MKYIITLMMLICANAHAYGDNWLTPDKPLHAENSAIYGLFASAAVNETGWWNWKATGLCMIPGIAKEYLDHARQNGSGWSNRDLGADAIGCIAGVTLSQQTTVRFMHRNDQNKVTVSFLF